MKCRELDAMQMMMSSRCRQQSTLYNRRLHSVIVSVARQQCCRHIAAEIIDCNQMDKQDHRVWDVNELEHLTLIDRLELRYCRRGDFRFRKFPFDFLQSDMHQQVAKQQQRTPKKNCLGPN